MQENRLKISNPQRIARILKRICQASLPVMIRSAVDASVAVKGRAANVLLEAGVSGLRISNISERGVTHLGERGSSVQVEFVMMSTKVLFVSTVLAFEQNSVLISIPATLISIERRKNQRYNTTEDLSAFLDLSFWRPEAEDITAPPYFSFYRSLSSYISIGDLSLGGVCAVARFPAVTAVLRRGLIDDRAKLVLPMRTPLDVSVEIRWIKRIKEHVKEREGASYMRFYRFGAEFINPTDEVRLGIRQFIQQLGQADAI